MAYTVPMRRRYTASMSVCEATASHSLFPNTIGEAFCRKILEKVQCGRSLSHSIPAEKGDDLVAVVGVAFAVDAAQVRLHRGLRDEQRVLDVLQAVARHPQAEDLAFAGREVVLGAEGGVEIRALTARMLAGALAVSGTILRLRACDAALGTTRERSCCFGYSRRSSVLPDRDGKGLAASVRTRAFGLPLFVIDVKENLNTLGCEGFAFLFVIDAQAGCSPR